MGEDHAKRVQMALERQAKHRGMRARFVLDNWREFSPFFEGGHKGKDGPLALPPTIDGQARGDRSVSPEVNVDTECERHHRNGVCVFACVDTTTVYVGDKTYESVNEYEKECPDDGEQ